MVHDQLHWVNKNPPPHKPNAFGTDTVHIPTLLGPDDAIQAPSFIFEKILVPRRPGGAQRFLERARVSNESRGFINPHIGPRVPALVVRAEPPQVSARVAQENATRY
jgi:hypothetical protein